MRRGDFFAVDEMLYRSHRGLPVEIFALYGVKSDRRPWRALASLIKPRRASRVGLALDDWRSAPTRQAHDQTDQEEDEENEEEDFSDAGGGDRDAAKTKDRSDDRHDEKD